MNENTCRCLEGTATLRWQSTEEPVGVPFCKDGKAVYGSHWAVSLRLRMQLQGDCRQSSVVLCAEHDGDNLAGFPLVRNLDGANGFRRYIIREGVRMQTKGGEIVMDTPVGETWEAELTFLFCRQTVSLFWTRADGQKDLVTSYPVNWAQCRPKLVLQKELDAELSEITVIDDPAEVQELYHQLTVPASPAGEARILFLGNSCLFYYDVPSAVARLAYRAGYRVEVNSVLKSSAQIGWFVDPEHYLYNLARLEMAKGYDTVVFQGLSTDIDTPEDWQKTCKDSALLAADIRKAGAQPYMYNRPTRLLRDRDGDGIRETLSVMVDGKQYDALYGGISRELDMGCVYANRAFSLAYQENENVKLWYKDDAHSSALGGYLAACVIFASYFHTSCQSVGDDGLPPEDAAFLRQIADRVALQGEVPAW